MGKILKRQLTMFILIAMVVTMIPIQIYASSIFNVLGSISNPAVNSNTTISYQFQVNNALSVGDKITLTLPEGFTVPSNIPLSEVKLNVQGTEVIDGISNIAVDTSNDVVIFTLDTSILAADFVNLTIYEAAGIKTPADPGHYLTQLTTSKDTTAYSYAFDIYSEVSQPVVSVYSNHVKKVAAYKIVFHTGDTSNSFLDGSNNDTISLSFPESTVLPTNISNSAIRINGEVLNQGNVLVNTNGSNRILTLTIPNGLRIPNNTFVQLEISEDAGIVNPSESSNQYSLDVWTSKDNMHVESHQYAIFDSIITVPEVTVTPNIVNEAGAYFVDFRTSSEGDLVANRDRIYFLFPKGTVVPTIIDKGNVLINNIPLASNPFITNDPSITKDAEGRYQMEMPVPTNIETGADIHIQINPSANIKHPAVEGNYILDVWTSQDLVKNKSMEYLIADAITGVSAWVSPDIAGQIGQYNIAMENGDKKLELTDYITIRFPDGTEFTKTDIENDVFIDGVQLQGSAIVNSAERTITLNLNKEIQPGQIVNMLFLQNAGIKNPLKQSDFYSIQVKTSKDVAYQSSNAYAIRGNHIVNLSASVSQNGVGLNGEYLIQFKVSNVGGLLGGVDTITLKFPEGTTLTSSLNYTSVQVNDQVLDKALSVTPSTRTLRFTVPTGVNILQNGDVKIFVSSAAEIRNPSAVGEYSLEAYTSRDPVAMESNAYKIGKQISTPTVALSPNSYQAYGQYAIGFYTSNIGQLSNSANDFIDVRFPNGTAIPTISASNVKVKGISASKVEINQQTVRVYLPNGMTIGANDYVGIVFPTNAGIRNPSSGTYQLVVSTSKDTSFVPSQSYTTTGYASSPTTPTNPSDPSYPTVGSDLEVELSSTISGDIAEYSLKYRTSDNGALKGGLDEIMIGFSSDVDLPNYFSKSSILVNNVPINMGWIRRNGQTIVFHLPTTVDIGNNSLVNITITKQAEIRNPSSKGSYRIWVETSKDSDDARGYYTIIGGSAGNLKAGAELNNADKAIGYSLIYTTSSNGSLKGGYDYVNIKLPSAYNYQKFLSNIRIKVNGYAVNNEMIQQNLNELAFLLPYQVDVANKRNLNITIEDDNSILMPKSNEDFVFMVSTSKDKSWTTSNKISLPTSTNPDTGSVGDDEQDDLGNGYNPAPTQPANPNNTEIKLYINKKDAFVNGDKKVLSASPQIVSGHTMVPLRFITEILGGSAEYRPEDKRIIIIYNEDYLVFTLNDDTVYTKDDTAKLPIAPKAINGSTIVPLRFIAEWMNIYTTWNSKEQSVLLQK